MALDQQTNAAAARTNNDPMPLNGIDHVELWVGNAKQAAFFYQRAFGFRVTACSSRGASAWSSRERCIRTPRSQPTSTSTATA
jgi:catechol-2,3-dioxygenase